MVRGLLLLAISLLGAAQPTSSQDEADWPAWRHDAGRTAATPHRLPDTLTLQWERSYPALRPGWPDQLRMQLDAAYEPVVAGRTMYVPSPRTDTVTAIDTRTGEEKWIFFTDGPVRYAPVAWGGRVYFGSDDGHLYCVDGATGGLVWKFRGAPSDRRILGNERLISTWPVRGAPVIADGTVYFAAGIWPFMGIFLHALDARTGKVVWTTEGDGSTYRLQPHNTDAFAGVAPQGPLAVAGDKLLIPGGRSVPACYDRRTGKFVHFKHAENGRRGGAEVATIGSVYFAGGSGFDVSTGQFIGEFNRTIVLTPEMMWYAGSKGRDLFSAKPPVTTVVESLDRKGEKVRKLQTKSSAAETTESPKVEALIRAGNRVYAGTEGRVTFFEGRKAVGKVDVPGTPASLLAADSRLFVVTRQGKILCYGSGSAAAVSNKPDDPSPPELPEWAEAIKATGGAEGYAVVFSTEAARPLAGNSLRLIHVLPGEAEVAASRLQLLRSLHYGERAAVHRGTPAEFPLPPYLASALVCEVGPYGPEVLARLFHSLRPYGGRLFLPRAKVPRESLENWIAEVDLEGAVLTHANGHWVIERAGALPGSGDWTHEHADAANTRVSRDRLVRAPLGLLWFGGPSHDGILPRHGHGPQPQVIEGRLIIEGVDLMRATDIYTGRLLWETPLKGVGDFFNNVLHQPGANASGTNFISMPDGIYVAYRKKCLKLDPSTGKIVSEFALPGDPTWGYLNVVGDYLIGGAEPLSEIVVKREKEGGFDDPTMPQDDPSLLRRLLALRGDNDTYSSSKRLSVLDRHTGKALWTVAARAWFRHNAICAGGGRLYAIDRLSGPQADRMKKKGDTTKIPPILLAFDLATGREVWRAEKDVFGTWLSYSESRDLLVEAGRVARDTMNDEVKGMRALRAADGKEVWKKSYSGPAMIHGDTILMEGRGCDLLTGAPRGRVHPITGQAVEWTWTRNHGCNTPAASQHLLTFRSGAAGFFDLANDGGTGNFGGFRSSCTNNLIVAGGLLNAPDYTRTCTCSYQNQASLALVPMPDAEMWTFFGTTDLKAPVRRIGVNLGAPGDRKAEDGTFWLEHPSVGGRSPSAPLSVSGDTLEWFRRHASRMGGQGLPWVTASGVKGITSLTLTLEKEGKEERQVTVRLYFAEPDGLEPGKRVFDVSLQGQDVIAGLDIAREAGGPDRGLVKEFRDVTASRDIKVKFKRRAGEPLLCGIEVLPAGDTPAVASGLDPELTVPESPALLRPSPDEAPSDRVSPPVSRGIVWLGAASFLFLFIVTAGLRFFRRGHP